MDKCETVLLDTNCLLDLAEDRAPQAAPLRQVIGGYRNDEYELVAAAITASENPKRGAPPKTWEEFVSLLDRAGLPGLWALSPMGYWDVTFWGHALWTDEAMKQLEQKVHAILAPSLDMEDRVDEPRWRNTKCDVQLVWTALWHEVDVLITSDKGILSKARSLAKLGINVLAPASFVAAGIPRGQVAKDGH